MRRSKHLLWNWENKKPLVCKNDFSTFFIYFSTFSTFFKAETLDAAATGASTKDADLLRELVTWLCDVNRRTFLHLFAAILFWLFFSICRQSFHIAFHSN